jgi:CYTH domain-containing protein
VRAGATLEVERRFLIDAIPSSAVAVEKHVQSYLFVVGRFEMRIRSTQTAGAPATHGVTLKVGITPGSRIEIEMPIPARLAVIGHRISKNNVRKTRHHQWHQDLLWEIDRYSGRHEGLLIAEVELPELGTLISLPTWVRTEVTADPKWSNRSLSRTTTPGNGR